MNESIKKYQFKTGLPIEFEVVSLKDLYGSIRKVLTVPHRTDFYHIIWFKNKTHTYLVDFEALEIDPDTILFLSKNKVQCYDEKSDLDGQAILFTDDFFCKTIEQARYLHSTSLFNDPISLSKIQVKQDGNLQDLIDLIKKELSRKADVFQPDLLRNLLHNFLLESEREKKEQGFKGSKKNMDLDYILLFKNLLEENYEKLKLVKNYATQLHITEKRLNQATSAMLGKSPKQIIDERVLLEAKRSLIYTSESVKEIGYKLGFEEPTNFIKYFRKHTSKTPIEFREKFFRA